MTPIAAETGPAGSVMTMTTAGRPAPDLVELRVPGTDYRLHLVAPEHFDPTPGRKVAGVIQARARRVDIVGSGGRFLEPIYGRPRRAQGVIVGGSVDANTLEVRCGGPIIIATLTDPRQRTADFAVGQMVAFDIERGAEFGQTRATK